MHTQSMGHGLHILTRQRARVTLFIEKKIIHQSIWFINEQKKNEKYTNILSKNTSTFSKSFATQIMSHAT